MTSSSHNVDMKDVRIADLKARLSEHLRLVRGGERLTVLDRNTPIAHIVPVPDAVPLRVRKPAPGAPAPGRVPVPGGRWTGGDIVALLLEERQGHR
jgi:antitoxin (DNA-binding transcriptional repressor) of toxin-antitoxin stability system